MVPDTVLRLASVLKALDDVIAPALAPDAALAHEQLALIKRSIALAMSQIPHEFAFMVKESQSYAALARSLCARIPADNVWQERLKQRLAALAAVAPATTPSRPALEAATRALRLDLEQATRELLAQADPATAGTLSELVLAHSEQQNIADRLWVVQTGFDPDPASLPSLETYLDG